MAGAEYSMLPVRRVEMVTSDVDVVCDAIGDVFVGHRPRLRRDTQAEVDGCLRAATAGALGAGLIRQVGVDYVAQVSPVDSLVAGVVVHGTTALASAREEVAVGRGGALLMPLGTPFTTDSRSIANMVLQVPWDAAAELAEEQAGLPAAGLRFESVGTVSDTAGRLLAQTAQYIYSELVTSGITEVSPLVARALTRLAASALLTAFPNTTMTVPYLRGPGHLTPAAVRRAADYIHGHADQPLALAGLARQAGTTPRALQYAFRRHYGTTPMAFLRQVRLEWAHQELRAANPATGITVAGVARRWGWINPGHFAAAYRRQYGAPPSRTLRSR